MPIAAGFCPGFACNEVFVTTLTPADVGTGDVNGVTDGFQVDPPLKFSFHQRAPFISKSMTYLDTVNSNELPARTSESCASLCRKLNNSSLFTLMSASPAKRPALSAMLPTLTFYRQKIISHDDKSIDNAISDIKFLSK